MLMTRQKKTEGQRVKELPAYIHLKYVEGDRNLINQGSSNCKTNKEK